MRSIPKRGSFLFAALMLLACSALPGAQAAEPTLQLDPDLHTESSGLPQPPPPRAKPEEPESALLLSQSIQHRLQPALAGSGLGLPNPAASIGFYFRSALQALWLTSMLLLGVHLLREWLRVLRVRVHRPARAVVLEHARWPTISILIPARGSAAEQTTRIASLAELGQDYPPERVHFVPMFDPAEPGVAEAVAQLAMQLPGRVHPLPMMAGPNTTLAAALHAAVPNSIGGALLVLDQDQPLPDDWLRKSITPLLDPAIACVLTRAVISAEDKGLASRLDLLADQADTLLATQNDALSLLLCGKARIRALRRQALKSLHTPDLSNAPDGASLVLGLTQLGWQSALLGEITRYKEKGSANLISSPRLHPGIALQSLRLASLLLDPKIPAGARRQAGSACFSALLPLIWLLGWLSSLLLYFTGTPLGAGMGVAICTACSFDPHGTPAPAFRIAAAARMAGARDEIRLLPLAWLGFTRRLINGIVQLRQAHREIRREHAQPRFAAPAPDKQGEVA